MSHTPLHPGLNLGEAHGKAHQSAEVPLFGFWVFMMSDLIIFGVLFATYITQMGATAGGPGPKELYDIKSAFIETLMLLTSSFTYGLASLGLKYHKGKTRLIVWLIVTLILGVAFLGMELHDFSSMADKGGVPQVSGFVSAFFALVPLHGLHVTGASLWLIAILGQIAVHGVDDKVKSSVLRLGLLWHFLDVVWVGIFSIVYLGGLA